MTADPLLAVRNIEVLYKRSILGVHAVSLNVSKGQVVVILGSNGAGKTTTLRAISGFIGLDAARVTKGEIVFDGVNLTNLLPHHCARLGIALVPEREKIFPNLTVAENLLVPPTRFSKTERRRTEDMVFQFFPALAERRAREAGLLSGGERQMLGIGAKLVAGPRILLLDEMSLGLAPVVVTELMDRLLKIKEELGLAILLVEQNAALALRVADYAYVLENGAIAIEGDGPSMRKNPRIHEFYLGISSTERRSYRVARSERLGRLENG
jgi:branched-chain amino acid transport system ATP-binding protein